MPPMVGLLAGAETASGEREPPEKYKGRSTKYKKDSRRVSFVLGPSYLVLARELTPPARLYYWNCSAVMQEAERPRSLVLSFLVLPLLVLLLLLLVLLVVDDNDGRLLLSHGGGVHDELIEFLAPDCLLIPLVEELIQRKQVGVHLGRVVHRDDVESGLDLSDNLLGLCPIEGIDATDGYHQDIDLAQLASLGLVQFVAQVAQVDDAQAIDLQDEGGVLAANEPFLVVVVAVHV